jgi:hypothetical protein
MGVSIFAQVAWLQSFYFKLPTIMGMTGTCHHTQLLIEMGSGKLTSLSELLIFSKNQVSFDFLWYFNVFIFIFFFYYL